MQKKIMSSLVGNKIYSNFRANSLLRVIQAKHPSVVDLSSAYIHIFESEEKLNSIELNNLKQILDYGEKADIQKKFNNVISTRGTKFITMDVGNFYLNTSMDWYEYIKIHIFLISQKIID